MDELRGRSVPSITYLLSAEQHSRLFDGIGNNPGGYVIHHHHRRIWYVEMNRHDDALVRLFISFRSHGRKHLYQHNES